jgi:Domain of unknown function (DUF5916)
MGNRRGASSIVAALVVGVFAAVPDASAQSARPAGEPAVAEKDGKDLHAYRIRGQAPRIDGRLDDEVWSLAQAIDDLVQNDPDNMKPPSERTVVQVAYDDRYFYVAARCFMRDASRITTGLGRRDNMPPSDLIRMTFDPRHDHLTAFTFDSNPSGVQADYSWYDDSRQNSDYDAVWEVATTIDEGGWNAEYRIPFSQLRFPAPGHDPMVWGFNVRRDIFVRGEFDRWVPTPRGAQGFVSRMGHLIFDETFTPPRRLELLPFTLGRQVDVTAVRGTFSGSGGLDARLGLGTSATLAATLNPDFAQVEQDPAVLNLTVFETFFPEKRPFFLEDSKTFVLPYSQFPLFNSRRIGQSPGRIPLGSGDRLVSKPDQTTILGAAKLTGKSSGWTYGALTALTSREYAQVESTTTDAAGHAATVRTERLIEPRTSYNVARLQRDIGPSNVGVIGTAVVREQYADAYTGGIDYNLRWHRNLYTLGGHWVGSHAPFSATDVRDGFGGASNLNYNGKHLSVYQHYDHFSRNFRNTDIGFLSSRVNKSDVDGEVDLIQPDPWKRIRNSVLFVFSGEQWNGDRLVFNRYLGVGAGVQFTNFWRINANVSHDFHRLDDLDTRGGPPIVKPTDHFWNLFLSSDSRKRWGVNWNSSGTTDAEGGWGLSFGPSLRLQPSTRVQTSVSASFQPGHDVAQWITNTDVDGDGIVDYVYGRLRRNVLSLTGRSTYAFTRDLTLEVYLQPFVAVGDYHDIRKLARPSSFEFAPATLTYNPDFNRKSVRGNVVLRWEYIRGSALYVVWQTSRSDASRPGVFSPLRDLGTGFSGNGTNVFMVKMNYWLGL